MAVTRTVAPVSARIATQSGVAPTMVVARKTAFKPSASAMFCHMFKSVARDRLTVLLTRRSDSLKHHAGQIAFPGGRIDLSDTSATAAALREASEEIGVDRTHVTPLGFLDTYTTGTGFTISPLVGLIEPGFTTVLQREEVAEAFEVPLAFLMDPANHEMHTRPWQGIDRRYYAMTWGHYYIWGATAGMLMNLRERLFAP